MIIFCRWHGVENTVGASSAEYTLGTALPACFQQPFPLRVRILLRATGTTSALFSSFLFAQHWFHIQKQDRIPTPKSFLALMTIRY